MQNELFIAGFIFLALIIGLLIGILLRKYFSERKKIDLEKYDIIKNELNAKNYEVENF